MKKLYVLVILLLIPIMVLGCVMGIVYVGQTQINDGKKMSDITLKIYQGGTAGAGSKAYNGNTTDATLRYAIQGDIINYTITDRSNYLVDTAYFELDAARQKYTNIDNGDIWRAFDKKGNIINSGTITHCSDTGFPITIRGEGWTGILKKRVLATESWEATNGAQIVKDILDDYFEVTNSDYNIDQTGISNTTNTLSTEYDGINAYEAIRDVAQRSYGGSSLPFDFYIYEDAVGSLAMKFFEQESAAAVATYGPADFIPNTLNISQREDTKINKVIVKGATRHFNKVPTDQDMWTEHDTNGEVQAFWTGVNAAANSNGSVVDTGSYSVTADVTDNVSYGEIILYLDDAQANDATKTPSELFTSLSGYKVDHSKDQWFTCRIAIDASLETELTTGGDAEYFYLQFVDDHATKPPITYAVFVNPDFKANAAGYNGPLFETGENGVFYTIDLPVRAISHAGSSFIEDITFGVEFNANCTAIDFYVDRVYFYEKTGQVEGSHPTSPAAPIYEKIIYDSNINNDSYANDIAEYILKDYVEQVTGGGQLAIRDATLKAGDKITLYHPEQNISNQSYPITLIEYRPNVQILKFGRNKTFDEIVSQVLSNINKKV